MHPACMNSPGLHAFSIIQLHAQSITLPACEHPQFMNASSMPLSGMDASRQHACSLSICFPSASMDACTPNGCIQLHDCHRPDCMHATCMQMFIMASPARMQRHSPYTILAPCSGIPACMPCALLHACMHASSQTACIHGCWPTCVHAPTNEVPSWGLITHQ